MNIANHLVGAAKLFPRRLALLFEEQEWSYESLHESVARFATGLRRLGVSRGDRVALMVPNIPGFAIAYYATLWVGGIAVSVNTRATRDEVAFILDDASIKAIVTTEELRDRIPSVVPGRSWPVIRVEGEAGGDLSLGQMQCEALMAVPPEDMDRDDPAAILYTSGTTGTPKGATLSQGNLVSNVWSFVHNCGIRFHDRILLQLPLFHCFGQNALLNTAVFTGATIVLQRSFRPDSALRAITEREVTMLFAVPTMFAAILDRAEPAQMKSVRYFFSAAAPLPAEVERRWREKFGREIYQGYGLTETSPFASYNHFQQYRFGSIGTPIENVEIRIVDPRSGQPAPRGELGEIAIKGPNVMLGYWNRPEETAQAIRHGWFHSGDLGIQDSDGYLYIVDRIKDMIDVGGMNVYPAEVENALYRHASIGEAAVFGVPDTLMGERVCAAVVVKTGFKVTEEELVQHCAENLADFKVPRTIEIVRELPKGPSGKILKRVLRERDATRQRRQEQLPFAEQCLMAGAEERRRLLLGFLSAQVAKALRIPAEQIDMDEPLSDLGLESLMAVDVAAHVRATAGFELTALSLLGGDTLRQIANAMALAIGRTRTTANEPSVRETDAFDDASSTKGQRDDGIDE